MIRWDSRRQRPNSLRKKQSNTLPEISSSSVISLSREAQCKFLARIQLPQKAEHFFLSKSSFFYFNSKPPKYRNFIHFQKDPFKDFKIYNRFLFQRSDKNESGGCEEDVSEGEAGGEEDQEEAETDCVSVWSVELRLELWRRRRKSSEKILRRL